ncbi:hypothetical protein QBC36DRAFT_101625 [Triangularia setosa]|uniref:Uncharacterized protein n=1 Tax=Triangularia setosa TaxID=2587417 RepID=A0AAN6VWS7_9PEZI|nr:hypothetical protein QBC36DRAFT_101625 [Podospora setosa]
MAQSSVRISPMLIAVQLWFQAVYQNLSQSLVSSPPPTLQLPVLVHLLLALFSFPLFSHPLSSRFTFLSLLCCGLYQKATHYLAVPFPPQCNDHIEGKGTGGQTSISNAGTSSLDFSALLVVSAVSFTSDSEEETAAYSGCSEEASELTCSWEENSEGAIVSTVGVCCCYFSKSVLQVCWAVVVVVLEDSHCWREGYLKTRDWW